MFKLILLVIISASPCFAQFHSGTVTAKQVTLSSSTAGASATVPFYMVCVSTSGVRESCTGMSSTDVMNWNGKVNRSGDTMSGPLAVIGNMGVSVTYGVTAGTFTGNGAALTALTSANLTGTIPAGLVDLSTVTTAINALRIIPYAQLSSTANQVPANTAETLLTYTHVDEQQTFAFTPPSGVITIPEAGVYMLVAGGQVGKLPGGSLRNLDLWVKHNNVDVARSSVRNSVVGTGDTKVVIQNTALRCNAGDTINIYIRVDNASDSTGLYATVPAVGPVIPSIILSIFKISQ